MHSSNPLSGGSYAVKQRTDAKTLAACVRIEQRCRHEATVATLVTQLGLVRLNFDGSSSASSEAIAKKPESSILRRRTLAFIIFPQGRIPAAQASLLLSVWARKRR